MKIQITNYTFNATAKTITFTDYTTIQLSSILLITNTTDNIIIYNFADTGGTVATNVLTLAYDTTAMSNTDKLLIYYDDPAISPATQALTGASTNGTVPLTLANTWYPIPNTVPTSDYALIVTQENIVGTLRMAFSNTGTPSATNGTVAPEILTVDLAGNNAVYYSSSNAGDVINWTAKIK